MIHKVREMGKRYLETVAREDQSPAVLSVRDAAERTGARLANAFRYLIILLIAGPVLGTAAASHRADGLWINLSGLLIYVGVTVLHTIVLRAGVSQAVRRGYDYLMLAGDYAAIIFSMLIWTRLESPDNFAFALKNTSWIYMQMPLLLTVFQFRFRLIVVAFALYCLIYVSFLGYGLQTGVPITNDWSEYINGPAIVLEDMSARPVMVLSLALALSYAVYRSLTMVRRIGVAEWRNASLSRYFAPAVVEAITAGEGADAVRGRRQQVTVLFADVRGFTPLSESLDPDQLVELLGELRRIQTEIIFAHGGTLDKYIGDAVMATFGTPRVSPEPGRDTKNAVLAGRDMLRAVARWNERRADAGLPPVEVGVGLHAGEVFVGNVGFEDRLEYTVIGDAVNVASRIEGLCKSFDWSFIVSREVRDAAQEIVPTAPLPKAEIKGKQEMQEVFRVLWAE